MHADIKKLIFSNNLYNFLQTLDVITRKEISLPTLVKESAKVLAMSLYEDSYSEDVSHGLMALIGAAQAAKYLKKEDQLKPIVQALWYAATEKKKKPYNLEKITISSFGTVSQRWRKFQAAIRAKNLKKAYGLFEGFIRNRKDGNQFRDRLLAVAMSDLYQVGHKLTYSVNSWQLAELLQWNDTRLIFFPSFHYFATAPRDLELYEAVRNRLNEIGVNLEEVAENDKNLSAEECEKLEELILCGDQDTIIGSILYLLNNGKSFKSLLDTVQLSASQAVINCETDKWALPVYGFNYCDACNYFFYVSRSNEKFLAPFLAALLVNRASRFSKKSKKNRDIFESKRSKKISNPFEDLVDSIDRSEPLKAVQYVKSILENGEDYERLFEVLTLAASKNDSINSTGKDIKFCVNSVNAFASSSSPGKEKLLVALTFFLAYIKKSHIIHNEIWA